MSVILFVQHHVFEPSDLSPAWRRDVLKELECLVVRYDRELAPQKLVFPFHKAF